MSNKNATSLIPALGKAPPAQVGAIGGVGALVLP
jgi:hypothetical protein